MEKGRNEARVIEVDGKAVVEIALTQGHVAWCDVEDWERVRHFRWHAVRNKSRTYAAHTVNGPTGARKVRMHQLILGSETGDEVDHIRDPGTDNRRSNLRFCDQPLNQQNTGARRGTSRFKGVSWLKRRGKWRVAFLYKKQFHFVGYFDDEEVAARVADEHLREKAGEFGRYNFPRVGELSAVREIPGKTIPYRDTECD